jgi:hypothetical protein
MGENYAKNTLNPMGSQGKICLPRDGRHRGNPALHVFDSKTALHVLTEPLMSPGLFQRGEQGPKVQNFRYFP